MSNKVKLEIEIDSWLIESICLSSGLAEGMELKRDIVEMCKIPIRFSANDIDWNTSEFKTVLSSLAYYMFLKHKDNLIKKIKT